MKSIYITVIHYKGATLGYGGPYVPVSHRFLWDGTRAYGAESLVRLFSTKQQLVDHFSQFVSTSSGICGDFSWEWI